jgi:hypothetical protein
MPFGDAGSARKSEPILGTSPDISKYTLSAAESVSALTHNGVAETTRLALVSMEGNFDDSQESNC